VTFWDQAAVKIAEEFTANKAEFLRQPTISLTMHPNMQDLAAKYREELNDWAMPRAARDSPVGKPHQLAAEPAYSPLTVQHLYYLHLIRKWTGLFLPTGVDHVVEIGGGYGNFCRIVRNIGYRGRYQIADLPQIQELQRYFLAEVGCSAELMPLDMELLEPDGKSILIATFSVNEMPLDVRRKLEPHYWRYDYLFFAHNYEFSGVNNLDYFTDLRKQLDETHATQHVADTHKRCWYLMGAKI
jgi:hypothetical protein